jgi:hypothetical protein
LTVESRTVVRISRDVIDAEVVLGEQLAALLQEGGLTAAQAERVRAELQAAGFEAFRRHRGSEVLPEIDAATTDRLMARAATEALTPEHQRAKMTHLVLRKVWLMGGGHRLR